MCARAARHRAASCLNAPLVILSLSVNIICLSSAVRQSSGTELFGRYFSLIWNSLFARTYRVICYIQRHFRSFIAWHPSWSRDSAVYMQRFSLSTLLMQWCRRMPQDRWKMPPHLDRIIARRRMRRADGIFFCLRTFPRFFLQEAQLSPRDSTTRSVSRKLAKWDTNVRWAAF